jgi:putative transport protein
MHAYGPTLAGIVAGTQTQPAVLAYANDVTKADPRVNLGYALVYPVAMIVKVILAPIIGGWL